MSSDCALLVLGPDAPVPAHVAASQVIRAEFRNSESGLRLSGPLSPIHAHGVARHADFLVLLDQIYRLLPPGGEFVVVDRFRAEPARSDEPFDGHEPLPWFLSLAERCGFEQTALEHRGEEGLLVDVRIALRRAEEPPRWRVGHVAPNDLPELSALFHRVFGGEMSESLWRWKYADGRGQAAAAWNGETLVGHYGGITRRIRYFGRAEFACQVADVMVEQNERGVLTRKGAFFLTGASLPEACSGYATKHIIGFGFPNRRAMRLPEKLGLYAEVGRIQELAWTPRDVDQLATGLRVTEVEAGSWPRFAPRVDRLWERMREEFLDAIIGVRDAQWFHYRYLQHPHHRYRLYHVTRGWLRRPVGLFVLREADGRCELLDLLGRMQDLPAIIAAARAETGRLGGSELWTWVTRQHVQRLQQTEHAVREVDVSVPTSIWTPAPPADELMDRWFLMSGDTDFH